MAFESKNFAQSEELFTAILGENSAFNDRI
jgi:hypothetical protein